MKKIIFILVLFVLFSCEEKKPEFIFTVPTHWVGLLNINNDTKLKQISLTVFTWSSIRTWSVSYDVFKDGYFGYVGGK